MMYPNGAWMRSLLELIKAVGPTAVMLGVLIYWMTQVADRDHAAMRQDSAAARGLIATHVELSTRSDAELINMMRVFCINQARTSQQREDCLRPDRAIQRAENAR